MRSMTSPRKYTKLNELIAHVNSINNTHLTKNQIAECLTNLVDKHGLHLYEIVDALYDEYKGGADFTVSWAQYDKFEMLPPEIIIQIAITSTLKAINTSCLLSQKYNRIICNNNDFWRMKFAYDLNDAYNEALTNIKNYGIPSVDWKELYQTYGSVYVCGMDYSGIKRSNFIPGVSRIPFKEKTLIRSVSISGRLIYMVDINNVGWRELSTLFSEKPVVAVPLLGYEIRGDILTLNYTGGNWYIVEKGTNYLYTRGNNHSGQLGLGHRDAVNDYSIVKNEENVPHKIKSIACAMNHTVFIDPDGYIWGMGSNYYGQLGLGDNNNRNIPTQIFDPQGNPFKAILVACSDSHTIIVEENLTIWIAGYSRFAALSEYTEGNIFTEFKEFKSNGLPGSISFGSDFTAIVDSQNKVWMQGVHYIGRRTSERFEILKHDNGDTVKARSLSCGYSHTIIIDIDGTVWGFGTNQSNQLGLEKKIKNVNITKITSVQATALSAVHCDRYNTTFLNVIHNK